MNAFAMPTSGFMNGWNVPTPEGAEVITPFGGVSAVTPLNAYVPNVTPPQSMAPASGMAGLAEKMGSWGQAQGLGMNMPTANLALAGVQTLGNLWAAYEQNKLAKKQFAYTRDITDTNLANQIRSYNTSLTDRITARAFTQGMSDSERDRYIEDNRARRGA